MRVAALMQSTFEGAGRPRYTSWVIVSAHVDCWEKWTEWRLVVVGPNVTGFFHDLYIPLWDLSLRVMIYRKHVAHESPKNVQLDLFTPDDGHFEYSAVATNLSLDLPASASCACIASATGRATGTRLQRAALLPPRSLPLVRGTT